MSYCLNPIPQAANVELTGDANLGLNVLRNEIYCKGALRPLKPTPFKLMHLLAMNAECIVSRTKILKDVWGYDFDPGTKIIEVQINYLRKILGSITSDYEIKTYWGKGISLRKIQSG
ncbi:winged helix-turn-helix domain-containing protein [Pseudomonas sp. NPDC089752]|uniref:winged helix-turn-helix domain-containing protein n=1 Tax=Pseudomonas sp. NPDC089752 TaxID=3364472 RepID=UPI00382FA868